MTTREKRTLNRYIDSEGEELPNDFNQYMLGAVFENLCVFCDESHINYPVYQMHPIKGTKTSHDIHACERCSQHVEVMLVQVYGESVPTEPQPSAAATLRKRRLTDGLFFDGDVYRYYKHLNPSVDVYITHQPQSCYICGKVHKIKGVAVLTNWTTLPVPVDGGEELSGGNIHICEECEFDLVDSSEIYRAHVHNGLLMETSCVSCKKLYYVQKEESEYRQMNPLSLVSDYNCPECAYKFINELTPGHWLWCEHNAAPRSEPMTRQVAEYCFCCRRVFQADLTLHPTVLEVTHYIDDEHILCANCAAKGVKHLITSKHCYLFSDQYYVLLSKNREGTWDSELIRIDHTGSKQIFISNTGIKDPISAVSIAFHEYTNMLYGSEQKELFDG